MPCHAIPFQSAPPLPPSSHLQMPPLNPIPTHSIPSQPTPHTPQTTVNQANPHPTNQSITPIPSLNTLLYHTFPSSSTPPPALIFSIIIINPSLPFLKPFPPLVLPFSSHLIPFQIIHPSPIPPSFFSQSHSHTPLNPSQSNFPLSFPLPTTNAANPFPFLPIESPIHLSLCHFLFPFPSSLSLSHANPIPNRKETSPSSHTQPRHFPNQAIPIPCLISHRPIQSRNQTTPHLNTPQSTPQPSQPETSHLPNPQTPYLQAQQI